MNEAMRNATVRGTPEQLVAAGLLEEDARSPGVYRPREGLVLQQFPGIEELTFVTRCDRTGVVTINRGCGIAEVQGGILEVIIYEPMRDRQDLDMIRYNIREAR